MNGPQHYAEAERVRQAMRSPRDAGEQGFDGWQRDDMIALAQFHATMALAGATAYPAVKDYCGDESTDPREWAKATAPAVSS